MAAFLKDQDDEFYPVIQLVVLFLILIFFLFVGQSVALGAEFFFYHARYHTSFSQLLDMIKYPDEQNIMATKILQIIASFFQFIVAAFFFSFFARRTASFGERNNTDFLKVRTAPMAEAVVLVILLVFVSIPVISLLGSINSEMKFPPFLHGLEEAMQSMEKSLDKTITLMLKMKSPSDIVLNIFMAGFLPAIGEELIFRGCIQQILMKAFRNPHLAIFLSAVLFSALHFQFYGFLPRFFLGWLFGYFFYWSGSIWLSATAHFFYNSFVIVVTSFPGSFPKELNSDNPQPLPVYFVFGSALLICTGMYGLHKLYYRTDSELRRDGKRLD